MQSDLRQLRFIAIIWGEWSRRGCTGLGYPNETAISRLLTSPGRSSSRPASPHYEPCPIARRFDNALYGAPEEDCLLLYARYVLGLSDRLLLDYGLQSEGQARYRVERALRRVGERL